MALSYSQGNNTVGKKAPVGAVRRGQVFVGKKWWCVASKLLIISQKVALYGVTAVRISNHTEDTWLCILK